MLFRPEEHADNAPETWRVVKVADRCWHLETKDGGVLEGFTTKHAAEERKVSGALVDLYAKEGRWYAGEQVYPWRPYAEVKAEEERRLARLEGVSR